VPALAVALAYFSIPIALAAFVSRRPDVEFGWVFWAFAVFIMACGTTHVSGIWTLWFPDYVMEGVVKGFTALASVATAIGLWPLLPKALALPSPEQLRKARQDFETEKAERLKAERSLRALEQHRQIERLVAVTPDAVIVVDDDGVVRFANEAASNLFGKAADAFVGQPFGGFRSPRARSRRSRYRAATPSRSARCGSPIANGATRPRISS
jgi:PAS domain-containing protein